MTMITIDILGKKNESLAKEIAKIVSKNGVEYLELDEKFVSIKIKFSEHNEYWFSSLEKLNEVIHPTFFVHTTVPGNKLNYSEIGSFITIVRDQISLAFVLAYPEYNQDIPDRNKVVVSVMPT